MSAELITPPAALPVLLADVLLDLRGPDASLNGQVTSLIEMVTGLVEGATNRSLISQGWRVTQDYFTDAIKLDHGPILSVESVKFYDADNVLQTLSPSDYYVDSAGAPGYIVPAVGKAWPTTYFRPNAVIVDYTAGYGTSYADVPKPIQAYIRARVVQLFGDSSSAEGYLSGVLDQYVVYG